MCLEDALLEGLLPQVLFFYLGFPQMQSLRQGSEQFIQRGFPKSRGKGAGREESHAGCASELTAAVGTGVRFQQGRWRLQGADVQTCPAPGAWRLGVTHLLPPSHY